MVLNSRFYIQINVPNEYILLIDHSFLWIPVADLGCFSQWSLYSLHTFASWKNRDQHTTYLALG